MCRDLTVGRKASVLKTDINIITTAATPTFRTLTSRTSDGYGQDDRRVGSGSWPCQNSDACRGRRNISAKLIIMKRNHLRRFGSIPCWRIVFGVFTQPGSSASIEACLYRVRFAPDIQKSAARGQKATSCYPFLLSLAASRLRARIR